MAKGPVPPYQWKSEDLRRAHAHAVKGQTQDLVGRLLASEIVTQDKLDGVGDEAFRRTEIMMRLLDILRDTDVSGFVDPITDFLAD